MTTEDTYKRIRDICDEHAIMYCYYEDVNQLEFDKVNITFSENGYYIETSLCNFNIDDIYHVNLEVKTTEHTKENYIVLSIGDGISWFYQINLWSYEV